MDDLPVWGFVGPPPEETKDEEHIYIYTHKSFDINYNDNRVRSILLRNVSRRLSTGQVRSGEEVCFATEAGWKM